MSIAEKQQTISTNNATLSSNNTTIAENEQRVYEAGIEEGKKAEWDAFWDSYQDYGNRRNYNTLFYNSGWTAITFKPKYDMICTYASSMFAASHIVEINKKVDVTNSTSVATMFANATYLKTITNLIVSENNDLSGNVFLNCGALENLTISGTIGKNVDVHWSTKLTHDSLMSIINHLKDGVSGLTVTLGATNLAKLTDAEKAIATQKGCTLI